MTISGCFVVASSQPFLAKKILQTNQELDFILSQHSDANKTHKMLQIVPKEEKYQGDQSILTRF